MPYIPVDFEGGGAERLLSRRSSQGCARSLGPSPALGRQDEGQQWFVKSGAWGGPAAAAWYKVLEVPDAVSGKDEWKIGVSYWSVRGTPNNIRYGRQWLWVYRRQSSCIMAPAKDYFFVKRADEDVLWLAPGDVVMENGWSEGSDPDPEDPQQEPQEGPLDSVTKFFGRPLN